VSDLSELVAQWEALCSVIPDEVTADLIDRLATARWRVALYGAIGDDGAFVHGLERLAERTWLRAQADPPRAAALLGALVRLRFLALIVTEQNSRRTPLPVTVARSLVGGPRTALWQAANPSASAAPDGVVTVVQALVRNDRLTPSLSKAAKDVIACQNSALVRDELLSKLAQTVGPRAPQLAWELSQTIQHRAFRGEAQAAAAAALASGNPPGGQDAAQKIDDPSLRCEALVAVARHTQDTDQAAGMLREAHVASDAVTDPFRRCQCLLAIAGEQATQAGVDSPYVLNEALETLAGIEDDGVRGEAIIAAAGCAAETHMDVTYFERILAAANGIADAGVRDEVIVALCRALPEDMGAFALQAAGSLADAWRRNEAIGAIAGMAARQDPGRAAEILASIAEGWDRDQALFAVASNLPASERQARLRTARDVTDPWYRCRALALVAKTVGDEEEPLRVSILDEALSVARSINGSLRGDALARLATDFIGVEPSWALSVARQIEDVLTRSEVLATAASQSHADAPRLSRGLYWESLNIFWLGSVGVKLGAEVLEPLISAGRSIPDVFRSLSRLEGSWLNDSAIERILSSVATTDLPAALELAATWAPQQCDRLVVERAEAIAKEDPVGALEMIANLSRRGYWWTAAHTAIESLAASDPAQAITMWEEASQQDQRALFVSLVEGLTVTEPAAAVNFARSVLTDPSLRRYASADQYVSSDLTEAVAAVDPEMALKIAALITDPFFKMSALVRVAELRRLSDPAWALRVLMDLVPTEYRDEALSRAAQDVALTDLDLALDWASRRSDTDSAETVVSEIAIVAASRDESRSLRIAASLSDERLRRETSLRIGLVAAERDPAHGLEIMETALAGEPGTADSRFIPAMLKMDRERAISFVFSLPEGWQRDSALEDIAMRIVPEDEDMAWELAQAIDDQDNRIRTLTKVACSRDRPDLLCGIAFDQADSLGRQSAVVDLILNHYEASCELSKTLSMGVTAALRECGTGPVSKVDRATMATRPP
jgi:hypothetical protein